MKRRIIGLIMFAFAIIAMFVLYLYLNPKVRRHLFQTAILQTHCVYKEIPNTNLNNKYGLRNMVSTSNKRGFSSVLNTGFGEPDSDGAGAHIVKTVNSREYGIHISRLKSSNWEKYYTYVNVKNSCNTSDEIIVSELSELLNNLGVEDEWLSEDDIVVLYSPSPLSPVAWF